MKLSKQDIERLEQEEYIWFLDFPVGIRIEIINKKPVLFFLSDMYSDIGEKLYYVEPKEIFHDHHE